MSRECFSLRASAVLIVYGWVFLLAFALAATSIRAKPEPATPAAHRAITMPSRLGANSAVELRGAQHGRGQAPASISSR